VIACFSLKRHGPHREGRVQQLFYCCLYIAAGTCLPSRCIATTEELLEAVFSLSSAPKIGHGSRRRPKPRTVLARTSSNLLLYYAMLGKICPYSRRRRGPISKHINVLGTKEKMHMGPETKNDCAGEGQHAETQELEYLISKPLSSNDRLCGSSLTALFRFSGVSHVTCMYGIVTAVSSGSYVPAFRK
jgi:hypothetical protein